MSELGHRLAAGVHRLSAIRSSPSRGVRSGAVSVTLNYRRVRESRRHRQEVQTLLRMNSKQHKLDKVFRVRRKHEDETSHCTTFYLFPFFEFLKTRKSLHANKTGLCFISGLQPDLQKKMTLWSKGCVCAEVFRCLQQVRAFCTVVFILRSERLASRLRLTAVCAATRSYGWNRDRETKDPLPLHRSRTAYYDILSVSPSATQAQIKTAYYKQSFIYHPDKNPGNKEATQLFSEISEAYTVLGNITLRRKYDRGILSKSDVQSAGRPSPKETTTRSTGSPQQQQQRGRQFSQRGGKPMFDFDAFYQAHYGEQLQRNQEIRARKQRIEEMRKQNANKWRQSKVMELSVAMLLATACLIFVNLSKS